MVTSEALFEINIDFVFPLQVLQLLDQWQKNVQTYGPELHQMLALSRNKNTMDCTYTCIMFNIELKPLLFSQSLRFDIESHC